jgi:polyhydroxyalkanoate synthesis repressor PhaR
MSDHQSKTEAKIIKRYSNRKLYDTVESRYVTLDEIAEMVKLGTEVRIIDNRSKEDLTSVTLAQIVFEEEKKKNQMPLSVLREIIRHPQDSLNQFINNKLNPRVESLKAEAGQRIEKLLGPALGNSNANTTQEPEAKPDLSPQWLLQQSQKAVEAWQHRIDERVRAALENAYGNLPALGRDMNALISRIEFLESRLSQIENKKK